MPPIGAIAGASVVGGIIIGFVIVGPEPEIDGGAVVVTIIIMFHLGQSGPSRLILPRTEVSRGSYRCGIGPAEREHADQQCK
jgi:hypothetical protein